MTNPQLGFDELAAAQEQPEVLVNAADRALSAVIGGQITIDFVSDANYTLQASAPAAPGDEWAFNTVIMTDSAPVLTAGRDVIYPDVDTLYGGPSRLRFVFLNQTAETLTVKRSGQTGVEVSAGATALLWHSGIDIVALRHVGVAADATSYADAKAGGFLINSENAIGAKISAALLPISDTEWHDVVNDIAGTLAGSPTIGEDATGRYVDFDGVDDTIDMGRSYSHGAGAPVPNFANEAGPAAAFVLAEFDGGVTPRSGIFAERELGDTVIIFGRDNESGDFLYRVARSGNNFFPVSTIEPSVGLHSGGFSIVDASTLIGYDNGAEELTIDPAAPEDLTINLTVGARMDAGTGLPVPQYRGKIYLVYLFNTDLSDAEHASLHANPWQVFKKS